MIRFTLILTFLISCGAKNDPSPPSQDPRVETLKTLFKEKLQESRNMRHQINGWLTPHDCDGMIWSGKYGSALCDEVNIEAAERDFSGRFDRRPPPYCWEPGRESNESRTTWSKDMAIGGLYPYILRCNRLSMIERHIRYGEARKWVMGEPIADGRAIYTPQLIGLSYALRHALGGDDNPMRLTPKVWPKGLLDYEAHLQIMAIWMESKMGKISDKMIDRIKEHFSREPKNPLYSYMMGRYSGNQELTMDLMLDPQMPMSGYVRCSHGTERCRLAEWIFVASLLLEDLK